ncbi:hypothetical protein [Desulfocurvus sp. DL9XJH121]
MKATCLALALLVFAGAALADTAVIRQDDTGVCISISGSRKEPAPQAAPEAQAPARAGEPAGEMPPGMDKLLSPEQQERARIIAAVLQDYSSKNHYSEFTETQCKQMSEAVWFRLTSRGIPARIAGGNVETQCVRGGFINYLSLANHAWVMAALSPGLWMALETTSGALVTQRDNPLYYTSAIYFDRPDDMYRFDGLRREFVQTRDKAAAMRHKLNADFDGKRFRKGSELDLEYRRRAQEINDLQEKNAQRLKTLERIFQDGIFLH